MADFNVRSDSVNVEHIMEQIRARIREKRGVDYTEAQIQELAAARLEKFIDPNNVHPNLLEEFHRVAGASFAAETVPRSSSTTPVLFETHSAWLRRASTLLRPILGSSSIPRRSPRFRFSRRPRMSRRTRDQLTFELIHNMVVEMTRLGVEVKNLTMRVESMQSRLEFNERRARALEGAVMYQPSRGDSLPPERSSAGSQASVTPPAAMNSTADSSHDRTHQSNPAPGAAGEGSGQRRRRRRRRGRRGGGPPNAFGAPVPVATSDRPDSTNPQMRPAESPAAENHGDDDGESEGDDGGSDIEPQ